VLTISCTCSDIPAQPDKRVISIADERVLPNFIPAFRTGFGDIALLNAAMLMFSSATKTSLDLNTLEYQSQVMEAVRKKLSFPEGAISESTVVAILLLAAVEVRVQDVPDLKGFDLNVQQARLAVPIHLELHLNAIQQLLNLCQHQGVSLSEGIKRAIFW